MPVFKKITHFVGQFGSEIWVSANILVFSRGGVITRGNNKWGLSHGLAHLCSAQSVALPLVFVEV